VVSNYRDPSNLPLFLKIPVHPPYLKEPEIPTNDFGLQIKSYYTTRDVCKVLELRADTLRYRFRSGIYPEPEKVGGKRRFSESDIIELSNVTKMLVKKGVIKSN
jgi:hypothetical protein